MRSLEDRELTRAKKDAILERDGRSCGYCCSEADCVDHIVPWSHTRNDSPENLIAACWLCNGIASDKVFATLAEKREHILKRRSVLLRRKVIPVWLVGDLAKLGRSLRQKIMREAIIVVSHEKKARVQEKIRALGLNPV